MIIGKDEDTLEGLILQKESVGPVYFYHCDEYNVYNKYRVLPPEIEGKCYELRHLEDIKQTDEHNHHHKWLYDNQSNLKHQPCQDMRLYSEEFTNMITENNNK